MNETATPNPAFPQLDAIEARILGCLIEKESTTPEQYPLTQNAVQVACNQKTSRDPVMDLEPGEVGHALRQLENRKLVRSQHGSRAQRYEHRFAEAYSVTRQQQGLIALLLLRGPQTANELLSRSERIAQFADVDELRHALDRLIQRDAPLAVRIPKGPGQREDRYMHLLSGAVDVEALSASLGGGRSESAAERQGLLERIEALEARVAALEQQLQ